MLTFFYLMFAIQVARKLDEEEKRTMEAEVRIERQLHLPLTFTNWLMLMHDLCRLRR